MEKPDLFRTGVLVWLFLLSVGDIWQFNAIKKLSLLQTQTPSDSSYKYQEEYQYEDVDLYSEIYVVDISHHDKEKKFHARRHDTDVEPEAEAEPHTSAEDIMTFRQKERTLRRNQNVRESMNLNRHSMQKSKRRLATKFTGDTDSTVAKQRSIDLETTSNQFSDTFDTYCVLVNEPCLDYHGNCENWADDGDCTSNEWQDWMEKYCQKSCNACSSLPSIDGNYTNRSIASFSLDFQIRTDFKPDDTSWSLSPQHDRSNMIIDSLNKNFKSATLSPLTLHTFEYNCVIVSDEEYQKKETSEQICYDFYLYDSRKDGICCRYGLGYFELNINNSTNPLISDRLYGDALGTPFCIDNNGSLVDNKMLYYDENESNQFNRYPSRECINDTCVCDSNPPLFVSNDDKMYPIKINVMFQMMSLSGSEKLMDINTPQYKAACWILKDDPYFTQQNVSNTSKERIEERMIQRYILAVFYFATTGENWKNDFYFLSNRSECEWNSIDDFYDYDYYFVEGSICNKDKNVISILFLLNNLDGTIIEELYGLTKLEQLLLQANENLRGSIPSSLGRLPALRYLYLFDNLLEGSIPPELFKAKMMKDLHLGRNNLSSSIPENIGNLKSLTDLALFENQLTGSIPESMYSLTSLVLLELRDNELSSSISPSISNLKRLEILWLSKNNLSGKIPSSIKHLSRLIDIYLNDNELSGEIPNGIESLSNIFTISLHNNRLNGSVSNDLCYNNNFYISADCRNDVFTPDVSCFCCIFCTDQTPKRNGECADTEITIKFYHEERGIFVGNSDYLKWSLIDQSTGQDILNDGPYLQSAYFNTRSSYKACAVNTGCYSLTMKYPPAYDTNYTIFWNDDLIHNGTFPGFIENGVYKNENRTMVTFNYDAHVEEFIFNDTTCDSIQLTCSNNDEVFSIDINTKELLLYSTAVKISGMSQIQNTSSSQSKALCWILQHEYNVYNNTNNNFLQTRFTQRYVLTILHLMSFKGLFGPNEYPPLLDECNWEGIQCKDNSTNVVTTISLLPSKGQIINGPLIDEIGSLAFVEVLRLSQTKLTGSIPLLLSNMWSLTELDLSSNSLSSSIPDTFFNELKHLKYLNLSNNTLTSSIPSTIGSYSEISTLILNGNQLIGSIPLGNFKWHSLEHLDISENELNSIDLSLLLNHTKFKDIFMLLSQLHYFNVSQNEIGGVIPSSFPDYSNMTHLDIHDNRFSGTVPLVLSDLRHLQHLNLQGNRLTGSIPSQLNKLKSLKLMALSNNELKGSISIDFDSLPDLDSLYLHNNKLSGEAPVIKIKDKKMKAYTSDCGFPSDSLEPVSCSSCDICCNSDNECQKKPDEIIRPTSLTIIFIFSVIALIVLLYIMKDHITSSRLLQSYFSGTVWNWNALMLISDKSVYQFMLTRNKVGWVIAFGCSIFQLMTLFLFVSAADIKSESGDLEYTMTCPSNSLECDNVKTVTSYGIMIFSFITAVWLLRDIVSSVKLMLLSFETRNIDFLFTSGVIFLVTVLSAWTSIYYNMALGTKNTELIVNAVILLFVIEIDERLYQLAKSCNPMWVAEIESNAREGVYITGDDLLLSHSIQKISKGFGKYRSKLSERFRLSMNQ